MIDCMAIGPTLKFSAGETVVVTLDNDLESDASRPTATMNTMHSPGSTNLHTHGLHVDSDDPQDNVYVTVTPGDVYTYTYTITTDHAASPR